jgi:hypothetical protein
MVSGSVGEKELLEALAALLRLSQEQNQDASPSKIRAHAEKVCRALESASSWTDQLALRFCSDIPLTFKLFVPYPRRRKALMKALIGLWTSSTEAIRLRAAVALVSFCKVFKNQVEICARKMYLSFLKACKSVHQHNIHLVSLMTNSLLEVFTLNPDALALLAFGCIRKLADTVRMAIKGVNGGKIKKIYSWQVCAALKFWGLFLTKTSTPLLSSLVSPFVTLIVEICCVQTSGQQVPFYLQMVRIALSLMESKQIFIPVNHILGQQLKNVCSKRIVGTGQKIVGSTFCLSFMVKTAAADLEKPAYKEALFEECHVLLMKFLGLTSTWACFPEVAQNSLNLISSAMADCQHQKFKSSLTVSRNKLQKLIEGLCQIRASVQLPSSSYAVDVIEGKFTPVDFKAYVSSLDSINQLKEKDAMAMATKADKKVVSSTAVPRVAAEGQSKKKQKTAHYTNLNKEDKLVAFEL